VGIDLGLFNNRIGLIADYYKKNTTDLLSNAPLPPSSGYSSSVRNYYKLQNQGIEYELSYKTLKGAVRSETSLNMSFNRGKVTDLGTDINGNKILESGAWFGALFLGHPPGELLGYQIDGIYQTDAEAAAKEPGKKAGDYKYLDTDKNGIINSDDQTLVSHLEPKFIYGLNETVTYKGFELAFQSVGSYGNQIGNEFDKYYTALCGKWNVTKKAWDNRWTGPGSTGTYAAPSATSSGYITFGNPSSLWLEPGSYFRVRDIRLTYSFPEAVLRKIKTQALSVYVSGTNLITITKYSHYDPEGTWSAINVIGWDRGLYPSTKSVICGVQITF
jgi:TonB-dependent starch-binding outer membrane protein SusC